MRSLEDAPAVVAAAAAASRLEIDLFPCVLADVRDEEVAGQPIEAETPRVAQAEGPDLRSRRAGRAGEGIRGRNHIAVAAHVEPKDLSAQVREGLSGLERVAAAAAVADGEVQVTVGAERDLAGVMV